MRGEGRGEAAEGWDKKRAWGRRETNGGGESKSLLAHADLTPGVV